MRRKVKQAFYLYLGTTSAVVAAVIILNMNSFAATPVALNEGTVNLSENTVLAPQKFTPNVTAREGGEVSDAEKKLTVTFGAGSVPEDLSVTAEETTARDFTLPKGSQIIGNLYDLRARNSKGAEVTNFKAQITLKFSYSKEEAKGILPGTIKIATLKDGELNYLRTRGDLKNKEVSTVIDHFSVYLITAERSNPILIFLQIILWILVVLGIAFGGYFGWNRYQRQKYQKEHQDDYIYKH